MDLYYIGYKTIPPVNNYTLSGIVPLFTTIRLVFYYGEYNGRYYGQLSHIGSLVEVINVLL